jgi:hypothetical protein
MLCFTASVPQQGALEPHPKASIRNAHPRRDCKLRLVKTLAGTVPPARSRGDSEASPSRRLREGLCRWASLVTLSDGDSAAYARLRLGPACRQRAAVTAQQSLMIQHPAIMQPSRSDAALNRTRKKPLRLGNRMRSCQGIAGIMSLRSPTRKTLFPKNTVSSMSNEAWLTTGAGTVERPLAKPSLGRVWPLRQPPLPHSASNASPPRARPALRSVQGPWA